ncbi:HmuY family protein [Tenacibaculum sp. IB213877]|uniref:HmuY family protein n=1 Tax=Tenacibaculum sp. IB213877 TaxID=3097351 RepID=UPI002A5A8267|nr:HmuY family protein [Tenacibaculum sp. IB213877]MDY0779381.1 HmuY family protein [Tenacibaculum sp. IB213877]
MKNKFLTFILLATVFSFVSCGDDNNLPSEPIKVVIEGATVAPEVGGPNEPNQVYVDLSTNTSTVVRRDSWDLGFYSGNEFRVVINGSIAMATGELTATDIDAVSSSDQEVQDLQPLVSIGVPGSNSYVDSPNGSVAETAIKEVSDIDSENHVYIVNLGYKVGIETPTTGSTIINGEARGWKKIKILKDGGNYVLQYADLDATTHEEFVITKNEDYHFTFFSFNTGVQVNVQPEKTEWDLNFTVSNKILDFGGGTLGAYSFSDFVINNTLSNVGVYLIDTEVEDLTYESFTLDNVVDTNFVYNDQTIIGSSWRDVFSGQVNSNVFYIITDTDGNLYKLQFLALTNENGERGYPQFVYSLLK